MCEENTTERKYYGNRDMRKLHQETIKPRQKRGSIHQGFNQVA